ncbi:MAG: transglutaminase domain-containing protein [Butyricicoccus pullicaecorum]|nr:transglutaminase domain-containing protein [Butyricicoccus pullicaecorum]
MQYSVKRISTLLVASLLTVVLAGCGGTDGDAAALLLTPQTLESTPTKQPALDVSTPLTITSSEQLQKEIYTAISEVRQPLPMEVSKMTWNQTPEIDVKNLYYEVIDQSPELKYAYDITAEAKNGILTCQISYMPYKTGYPKDWDGAPVGSLQELIKIADAHLGTAPVNIRLTDLTLTPDEMNRALQQVGGGYILCSLSKDGTQLTYAPAMGMTMDKCLVLLKQAEKLAADAVDMLVDETMTEREKAETLYRFLTEKVKYDHRYYSNRTSMPFDSQTAIGALRDGVAICGGYSHALKLLFEQVGIPCYNVTGTVGGEHHMWNIAQLDGQWFWFDSTSDRGLSPRFELRHFALENLDNRYSWESMQLAQLLGEQNS